MEKSELEYRKKVSEKLRSKLVSLKTINEKISVSKVTLGRVKNESPIVSLNQVKQIDILLDSI